MTEPGYSIAVCEDDAPVRRMVCRLCSFCIDNFIYNLADVLCLQINAVKFIGPMIGYRNLIDLIKIRIDLF